MSVTKNQIKKIEESLFVKEKEPDYQYFAFQDFGESSWYIIDFKKAIKDVCAGKKIERIYPDSEEGKKLLKEKKVKSPDDPVVIRGYG